MDRSGVNEPEQRETRNPVARAFTVLHWMADAEGTAWGLREIATGVAMHPSTLYRVLSHLQEGGIIQQDRRRAATAWVSASCAWHGRRRITTPRAIAMPSLKDSWMRPGKRRCSRSTTRHARKCCSRRRWIHHTRSVRSARSLSGSPSRRARPASPSSPSSRTSSSGRSSPDHYRRSPRTRPLIQPRSHRYSRGYGSKVCAHTRRADTGGGGDRRAHFGPASRVIGSVGITLPEQRFQPDNANRQAAYVTDAARTITAQLGTPAR